jgi:hypothetical protein
MPDQPLAAKRRKELIPSWQNVRRGQEENHSSHLQGSGKSGKGRSVALSEYKEVMTSLPLGSIFLLVMAKFCRGGKNLLTLQFSEEEKKVGLDLDCALTYFLLCDSSAFCGPQISIYLKTCWTYRNSRD